MNPAKKTTVLIAEDHAIVREGLSLLLRADGNFEIVGGAQTGREAVKLAAALRPDVILMDITMPELNGLEATRQILTADPAARIIMLSAHSDDEYIGRSLKAGAAGFLEKQTSAKTLTKAIREVAAGRACFSPAIVRRLHAPARARHRNRVPQPGRVALSIREAEVLQLIAEGRANKQIAGVLHISVKTVEKHRQSVMDKLDIHETAGLTRYAMVTGVIEGLLDSNPPFLVESPDSPKT